MTSSSNGDPSTRTSKLRLIEECARLRDEVLDARQAAGKHADRVVAAEHRVTTVKAEVARLTGELSKAREEIARLRAELQNNAPR